ncbi:MAG: hypothetical protein IJ080_03300 [Oscillospiraceae bacterium]|nr:hypothetical protein [Oscillospiraceae bacterium]MBQ8978772.1 hypothetical protein [Oscillospiraceae bacterium]
MEFSSLSEKAAYLLGLIKGKAIDDEVTCLAADLLHDIALSVDAMGRDIDDLSDKTDDLEQELYFLAEDSDEEEEEYPEEEIYSMACPNCGEQIEFEESALDDGIINCQYCGTPIEVGFSDEEVSE